MTEILSLCVAKLKHFYSLILQIRFNVFSVTLESLSSIYWCFSRWITVLVFHQLLGIHIIISFSLENNAGQVNKIIQVMKNLGFLDKEDKNRKQRNSEDSVPISPKLFGFPLISWLKCLKNLRELREACEYFDSMEH